MAATVVVAAPIGMSEETWQYDYDQVGNITNRWSSDTDKSYTYDSLYRLVTEVDSNGTTQNFTYDPIGNRLSGDLNGDFTLYSYLTENSHLQSKGAENYTRDAMGNTVSDKNGYRTFTYNPDNRLHQVFESGQLIATYFYNAFGQRTHKITPQGTTFYVYGLGGELQGEYDENGNVVAEYVYLNGEPVAQLNGDDSATYIHTDHLATPRRATDEAGEVVWSWNSDAFGEALANVDPDGDGAQVAVGLRFPGQYYDSETNLHYNFHRYYDPQTGRYITSDPIGLRGGINTYGYAYQNPVFYADANGLNPGAGCLAGSWGGPVGCGAGALIGTAVLGGTVLFAMMTVPGDTPISQNADSTQGVSTTGNPQCSPEDPLCENNDGSRECEFDNKQLQKKWKHAADFGVNGNYNSANSAAYRQAIQSHMRDPGTQIIQGTYRGQQVTHFYNSQTGINVMTSNGRFLSGWRLNATQMQNVVSRGAL